MARLEDTKGQRYTIVIKLSLMIDISSNQIYKPVDSKCRVDQ